MARPDAAASAALDGRTIKPVYFAFLDFLGDPVRANSSGANVTVAGSGDAELDGAYIGITADFVDVSPVRVGEGGSDSVTVRLSGIPGLDDDMIAQVSSRANWRGRAARLWRMVRDENNTQQGAIQHYYTGYMTALAIAGEPGDQMIALTIEGYLAAFSDASGRTYLDQKRYDPGDDSARAAIAIANGNTSQARKGGRGTGAPEWKIGGGGGLGPGFDGGRGLDL